ncbi:hypothetical protein PRUB_b0252 [Pseudoalteromonas rubra]|uniref:Aminotransferase class III n=1 Tax=Pseudoalteromonas rubra TaxID=43658 RepID=A0A8T0BZ93_9GAMM|nr:aminotransferase class III-fold pyridoxal phosphate-dependent enzyme [Pseudoalteromonas rubra]KAF7781129.1 hypothetical protein PRUB_b0252 [Pseudoalteromonas rubra]
MKCQPYRQSILEQFKLDLSIVRSKGSYHYDNEGRKILDGVSQYGALPLGHNSSELTQIVTEYLATEQPNFIQPFLPKSTQELAARLVALAGDKYEYVTFSNSGTETVEAAFKLARLKTQRSHILSVNNSFHGKTFAALSATGSDRHSDPVIVDKNQYDRVELNDLFELEQALKTRKYAAFIIEPVQGEGGMLPADREYLLHAAKLCKTYGTLFILDEIQTGMGRSGEILAAHRFNIEPDLLLLSKALGGGLIPIGAMIMKRGTYEQEFDSKHSSTFANGGLACAVGLGVLDALEAQDRLVLNNVKELELVIVERLTRLQERYPQHFSFNGLGLMYALNFKDLETKGNYIVSYAHRSDLLPLLICGYLVHVKGIFCMPMLNRTELGGAIRFQPALNVSRSEVSRFLGAFEEVCELLSEKRYDQLMGFLVGYKPVVEIEKTKKQQKKKPKPIQLLPAPTEGKEYRLAFLFHSTSAEDIRRGLPQKVKENFSEQQQMELSQWLFALGDIENEPQAVFEFSMTGGQGDVVNAAMIYSPISPTGMLKLSRANKAKLMKKYLQKASHFDANLIGLGAYTSVITRGGLDIASDDFHLTTGNCWTAISTCNAIREMFADDIEHRHLMVIGARGSVGRIALMDLSHRFGVVDVVGSQHTPLDEQYVNLRNALVEVLNEIPEISPGSAAGKFWRYADVLNVKQQLIQSEPPEVPDMMRKVIEHGHAQGESTFNLFVGLDTENVSENLDCVLSATSEGKAFISAEIFPKNCKIFDVARPFDVLDEHKDREVHEGGLVYLPDRRAMLSDCNIIGCRPGVNLACLSETILLGMDGVEQNYSLGKEISYKQAIDVSKIAEKHGFRHFINRDKSITNV